MRKYSAQAIALPDVIRTLIKVFYCPPTKPAYIRVCIASKAASVQFLENVENY